MYQYFYFYINIKEESLVNRYGYLGWLIPTFNLRGHVEIVPWRDKASLTNILRAKLAASSVIHSFYQNFPQYVPTCILFNTVNHSYNLVDPNTDVHGQSCKVSGF